MSDQMSAILTLLAPDATEQEVQSALADAKEAVGVATDCRLFLQALRCLTADRSSANNLLLLGAARLHYGTCPKCHGKFVYPVLPTT